MNKRYAILFMTILYIVPVRKLLNNHNKKIAELHSEKPISRTNLEQISSL